jgi:chondroitin AC lyase
MHRSLHFAVAFLGLSMTPLTIHAAQEHAPPAAANSDVATVRSRYVQSLLPPPATVAGLRQQSAKYAAEMKLDGSWPNIDYTSTARASWLPINHLERVLTMAECARIDRNASEPDKTLEAKTLLALKWWDDHDYRDPNWWWNEIGVPQLIGEIGNLILDQLPTTEKARMVTIMKRSDWSKWTGGNLSWGTAIEVARGCIEDDPAPLKEGFARMYEEIKIVPQPAEGIEQDDSFHQHKQQLYNGGYGLDYANDVARFIFYSWDTQFQVPPDKLALFSGYLLDGEQWMARGAGGLDYSTTGREITRMAVDSGENGRTPASEPSLPAGYRMSQVLEMLASDPSQRQSGIESFAERLEGKQGAPPFTGNKQFWCSDYMVHRRQAFFTSVKMLSNRMLNAELVNAEGKKSVHLSDGANYLYLTGEEYRNIFPVWDWTKIPGTTAIQGTLATGEADPIKTYGVTTFDGGVSDGRYGLAAMDLKRGNLSAKKAWFFFDDGYVALGAGITLENDAQHSVATDVNQPLLEGNVRTSEDSGPTTGTHSYDPAKSAWVYHDQVGYVFPPHTRIDMSAGPQTGAWSDIGTGSNKVMTKPVFDLWIDHGRAPKDESYEYIVLPNASMEETAQAAIKPGFDVLANTKSTQAVYSRPLRLAEIVFREAGALVTPLGRVSVDHSCLLLITKAPNGWRITASNPENQPLTLRVTVKGKAATIKLPEGNFAGSSRTVELQ